MNPEKKGRSGVDDSWPSDAGVGNSPSAGQIEQELERILQAPSFRSSKRCSEFLSFIVRETLEGRRDELKERTLGVFLFGREPSYDTPGDPIVRVKANEVRKRLAQFYDDHPHDGLVRIELAPGSYVPVFRALTPASPLADEPVLPGGDRKTTFWKPFAWCCSIAALCVVVGITVARWHTPSAPDVFWGPALRSDRAPILCVGSSSQVWILADRLSGRLTEDLANHPDGADVRIAPHEAISSDGGYFSMGSVRAALGLSSFLSAKGMQVQLRLGGPLSLDDFHNHTIVAVGAFSNPWTLERISQVRYRFDRMMIDDKPWLVISDSQNATIRWSVPESPFGTATRDFAIITRVFDPESRTVFISLAGLNQFGTEAAEEFVTKPSYWDDVLRQAPHGWNTKNLQIVIQTSVVQFRPTPPRVVAVYFW